MTAIGAARVTATVVAGPAEREDRVADRPAPAAPPPPPRQAARRVPAGHQLASLGSQDAR